MIVPKIKLILSLVLFSPLMSNAAYINNPIEKENNNFNSPLPTTYSHPRTSFLQQPRLKITGMTNTLFQKVASDPLLQENISLPFDLNHDGILNETVLLENSDTLTNPSEASQGQVPASFWLLGIGLIGLAKVKQTQPK